MPVNALLLGNCGQSNTKKKTQQQNNKYRETFGLLMRYNIFPGLEIL